MPPDPRKGARAKDARDKALSEMMLNGPGNTKTDVDVADGRVVEAPVRGAKVLWVVEPRTAAKHARGATGIETILHPFPDIAVNVVEAVPVRLE